MLIDKVNKYSSIAKPVTSVESALGEIEAIYNYKNRNKVYIKTNYLKSVDNAVLSRRSSNDKRYRSQAQRTIR